MPTYHVYNADGELTSIERTPAAAGAWEYPDNECVYEVDDDGIITGNVWYPDYSFPVINRTGDWIGQPVEEWVGSKS